MTNTMTQPTLKIRIDNNNTMDMDIKWGGFIIVRYIQKVIWKEVQKTLDKITDLCYNKSQLKVNWIFRDVVTVAKMSLKHLVWGQNPVPKPTHNL